MKITGQSTDQAILSEVGERLTRARLSRNLTQAELADRAGVAKRTIERMESGESVQLTSFVRILRALDLADRIDALLLEPGPSPMEQLKLRGKERKRASGGRKQQGPSKSWSWGE